METLTMPDWPKLWDREPRLQPQLVCIPWMDGEDAQFVADADCVPRNMNDTTVAALCRDAATTKLQEELRRLKELQAAEELLHLGCQGFQVSPAYAQAMNLAIVIQSALLFGGDSRLFAACEAVLDARPH